MKKHFYYLATMFVFLSLSGCEKIPLTNSDISQTVETERLKFSVNDFNTIYANLRKEYKNQSEENFTPYNVSFASLSAFEKSHAQNSISEAIGQKIRLFKKSNSLVSEIKSTNENDEILYPAIINELIEDNALRSLINEDGEIQVGNILYKISPYGTLFADVTKEEKLKSVFNKLSQQNDLVVRIVAPSSELNLTGIFVKATEQEDVQLLDDDIYFIDTFQEVALLPPPEDDCGGGGGGTPPPVNTNPYGAMSDEYIEFQTGAGSVFQTFFTNSTRYNYFDGEYRISALFYDRNYAVIKTLGLKVKLQKQGLLWWNKVDAEEIRAGWDYIVYKQTNSIPQISRPVTQSPTMYSPYTINPYDAPSFGWYTPTAASLYTWKFASSNPELFSIVIPNYLIPTTADNVTVSSSDFKPLVHQAWNQLKAILASSVPMSSSNDPNNFKFPVYDITNGTKRYLSINEMSNLPKTFNSTPNIFQQIVAGQKIRSYLSPYEEKGYNTDIIDIPLDFSTATITLSQNLNSPLSFNNTLNSMGISNLDSSYDVEKADVYGTVKHNGRWLGIRIHVNIKR